MSKDTTKGGGLQLRPAQRKKAKLRIGLSGPSGSGKTYSALLLASGIAKWEEICVIDTERQSADLYSDLGPYNVITLDTPYSPKKYTQAIETAEEAGMKVIIIDSVTHEWGEVKNMVDKLGGKFQDWAKVTPIHERFIDSIVSSKCHVITTVRSKTDYAMTTEGGKTKVQKVGLKSEQRDGFEYELTVSFDLNINHMAETSKDRTAMFMDGDPFVIDKETGKALIEWANSGIDPKDELIKKIDELLEVKAGDKSKILDHFGAETLRDLSIKEMNAVIIKLEKAEDAPEPPTEKEKVDGDQLADDIDKGLDEEKSKELPRDVH